MGSMWALLFVTSGGFIAPWFGQAITDRRVDLLLGLGVFFSSSSSLSSPSRSLLYRLIEPVAHVIEVLARTGVVG